MTKHPIISTSSSPMEELKYGFMAALYTKDMPKAEDLYKDILALAGPGFFSETNEKYLRQIQLFVRTQSSRIGSNKSYTRLQTILRDKARANTPFYLNYDKWEEALDLLPWQMETLIKTAVTFQLTSGCSNFCRRCNEWALPRTRGHFTREAALTIIKKLLKQGNIDLALYGGSDPLDWEDHGATLEDLLSEAGSLPGPKPNFSLLTKIPKGKESRLKALIQNGVELAVSLTNRNRERIEKIEQDLGKELTKQHATADLLIPACLDEDFQTIKPSITDSYGTEISLDGAFIIIPTFTSALYPFGHKKIPVTRKTKWFPLKKLGRPALLQDYFKPLQVIGKEGKPYYLDHLLDVQVENILVDNGDYDLTPPGMRSIKEYFEVFDEKARLKRKSMTLSVMRRLKKVHLKGKPFSDLRQKCKNAYLGQIRAHLDFCRKDVVNQVRQYALAYFLRAVFSYVSHPSTESRQAILKNLTAREYEDLPQRQINWTEVNNGQDVWIFFRHTLLKLLHEGTLGSSALLLEPLSIIYNTETDQFISD